MKEIRKLCEFPALSLSIACELAEKYKEFYELHGYENVLFSIHETSIFYRFRVEVWGRPKEDEN